MAHTDTGRAWARGGTIFGATMMIVIGIYQVLMGIAAIVRDGFFVVTPNYVYELSTVTWGWIHLIVGAVAVLVGLFLFTGAAWARGLGIALAGISAITNFFFLPYYPLWSLLVIALDAWIIWSLATTSLKPRHAFSPSTSAAPPATEPTTEPASDQTDERWPRMNAPSATATAEDDEKARSRTAAPRS